MARNTRLIKDFLWFFALWGLVAGVFRLWFGLGATTHLSDEVPWGLWKVLNMVAGVALSTSGFTIGFLVYVLRLEQFKPLLKPAILVAFLGYGSSCCALLFDIGLPLRFWHPLVMWNEHSFLFEVFWCVLLYFTVTCIELAPTILERMRAERWVRALHGVAFGVVVVGISLSSLHHSSLGSLFLVTPLRLHPLWYSPLLPLFFILSAMGAGLFFLLLVRILYARWYDPEPVFGELPDAGRVCAIDTDVPGPVLPAGTGVQMPMLRRVAGTGACILAVYLVLKIGDLAWHGAWRELVAGTWESWLYGLELVLTAVLPVALVAWRRSRRSPIALGLAGLSASLGLALNRMDVGIFGYYRDAQAVYVPSLAEWALSVGVVAAAGLALLIVTEHYAIFDDRWQSRGRIDSVFMASFDSLSRVWNNALWSGVPRVTLLAVIVLPLAWAALYPPYADQARTEHRISPPLAVDASRRTLQIDGDRRGVSTVFPHAAHQERLGGESSCATCHHVSLPGDRATPCSRCHRDMLRATETFDHFAHMEAVAVSTGVVGERGFNLSCAACHADDQPRTATGVKSCVACHERDMWLVGEPDPTANLALACSYQAAMHGICAACHRREELRTNAPQLGECVTCHASYRTPDVLVAGGDGSLHAAAREESEKP